MSSFRSILLGRAITNIGDSILYIYLTYFLAQMTGSFKQLLVAISIGEIIAVIYSAKSIQKTNYVQRLIRLGIIQAFITIGIFISFANYNEPFYQILFYICVIAFYILNPLAYSIDAIIITKLPNFDTNNYFTKYNAINKTIDLLSGLLTTFIIFYLDITTIGIIDTLTFIFSIIFIKNIKLPTKVKKRSTKKIKINFKEHFKRFIIKEFKAEFIVVWTFKFVFAMYIVNSVRLASNFGMFKSSINYAIILGAITLGYAISLAVLKYHFSPTFKFNSGLISAIIGLSLLTYIKSNIIIFAIVLAFATTGLALLSSFYNNSLAKIKESDYHKEMRYVISIVIVSLITTSGYIFGEWMYEYMQTMFVNFVAYLVIIVATGYYLNKLKQLTIN